jgi:thiol-disulfide isomerase/thioredoxin
MKVIKIGASWCNSCIVMRPRWEELEKENKWLKTEYYDYDFDKKKIKKYIKGEDELPIFIFLDEAGKELMRLNGEVEKEKLVRLIEEYRDK